MKSGATNHVVHNTVVDYEIYGENIKAHFSHQHHLLCGIKQKLKSCCPLE